MCFMREFSYYDLPSCPINPKSCLLFPPRISGGCATFALSNKGNDSETDFQNRRCSFRFPSLIALYDIMEKRTSDFENRRS